MNPRVSTNDKVARKRRRVAEKLRRIVEELRRRQTQADRDRRRRWLLALLLALFESKPVQIFFPVVWVATDPAPPPNRPPARKSVKKLPDADTRSDNERRYLYD